MKQPDYEKRLQKIKDAAERREKRLRKPKSLEHRLKLSLALKGRKLSPETKAKMKGRKAWNAGRKFPEYSGKNHGQWKGDNVGYWGIHSWMKKSFGKPQKCEDCGTTKIPIGKKNWFHWANISGKYFRDRSDWKRLCVPCHRKLDAPTQVRGEGQHLAKLTDEKIRVIRWAREKGLKLWQLAKMFGVTETNIGDIVNRKTWRHID